MTRIPSCLISCTHAVPIGGCGDFVGRHGAMKPAGRACERNGMGEGHAGAGISFSPPWLSVWQTEAAYGVRLIPAAYTGQEAGQNMDHTAPLARLTAQDA